MKISALICRRAAVLFSAFVAWEGAIQIWRSGGTLYYCLVEACLALAAVASAQIAFGQPKLPRLVWRIFGPIFSVFIAWTVAWSAGWLATRLAIRPLGTAEKLTTFTMLSLFALYALSVVAPLFQLGEWKTLSAKPRQRD